MFQYTCTCVQANLTCIHVKKNTDTGFIGMVDNDTHTWCLLVDVYNSR